MPESFDKSFSMAPEFEVYATKPNILNLETWLLKHGYSNSYEALATCALSLAI